MEHQDDTKKAYEELPTQHRIVISLLREGIENTTTCNSILKLTNISMVNVRKIVTDLVVNYGFVIGANNNQKGKNQCFLIPVKAIEEKGEV